MIFSGLKTTGCFNSGLLAPGVQCAVAPLAWAATQAPAWAQHLPDERGWLPVRRQSFLAGRAVADQALAALGQSGPVMVGDDFAPCWPAGLVGSIAHSGDFAIAVAGSLDAAQALGVDVEPDQPLPADATAVVLQAQDHAALREAFGGTAAAHTRLVFVAKECVHKALNPLCGAWLEFDEVAIHWLDTEADQGRWRAEPLSAAAVAAFGPHALCGRWQRSRGSLWSVLQISP